MREKKVTAADDEAKEINVELAGPIRRRLKVYVATHDLKIKDVVNAALDRYLPALGEVAKKKRGT